MIAAAAVYMALVKLNVKMPSVAWWSLMEANIECMEELICELECFYEANRSNKYSVEKISGIFTSVGLKNNLINVFPVNYYRKIQLDLNN